VSLNRTLDDDHAHERTAADGTCAARMTSVNVSQRMHELSDGMIRPFSATPAVERGPYWGSRLEEEFQENDSA